MHITVKMCDVGQTALHWALVLGKADCVRALIEHGADINKQFYWSAVKHIVISILKQEGSLKKTDDL